MAYRFRGLGQGGVLRHEPVGTRYVEAIKDPYTGQVLAPARVEPILAPAATGGMAPSSTAQMATQVPTQTVVLTPQQTATTQVIVGRDIERPVAMPIAPVAVTQPSAAPPPAEPNASAPAPSVASSPDILATLSAMLRASQPPVGQGGSGPPSMSIIPLPDVSDGEPTAQVPVAPTPTPATALGGQAMPLLLLAAGAVVLFMGRKPR